jgi:hypothetical protein
MLLKRDGNIVADTGYYYENKLIEFRKNVVATKGRYVYKSEELIWDQAKKQVYSNKKVSNDKSWRRCDDRYQLCK